MRDGLKERSPSAPQAPSVRGSEPLNLRRATAGVLVVISATAPSGCSDRPDVRRDIRMLSSNEAPELAKPPQVLVPTQGRCVPLWPARVRLSGVIREEHRLGPPGYGENPERDEKVTIFVLYLKE